MDKGKNISNLILRMIKALLTAYVLTGGLLLLLALLLYRFQLSRSGVNVGIIAIYILSCFLGGFLEGKMMGTRKFIWGAAAGFLYFILLTLISFAVNRGFDGTSSNFVTTLILCIAGGTLGGMLS
ncbi:MAG: TIGR04086 family membrane protein [Lachnospiraceae bacterium]|jgi:putative membrane protein (TIGR04086 family)|nr:TIGR04086 family membrane protein [Lachnospiraceae bacterium]MCI8995401.1 TIGR04086 family membrane protein [Lachnospiraceae bacterium]